MMDDLYWMKIALTESYKAFEQDEIPVGAVLTKNNQLIMQNHNCTQAMNSPLAHAEMLILLDIQTREKYLYDYTLYVTLEPCLMCAGAMILSKLGRLVYGASDPKTGVVGSVYNVMGDKHFNHHPEVFSGILEAECGSILKKFFQAKRGH